ncbi:hypothetical protein [Mucilaginibacter sp. SJ]|uniref:hypothetical protein n=1 Tax=Mucilaginibacter sp. SJ TaxID=3029053 RepID=UPI0023A9CDE9|nr:hypothetical protein [Mucilaginibacter sp. SJ]WDZ98703.1 hypothetical protein MusilaSJ_14605 [Mucilaginibacter sp. SJ]
MSHIDAALTHIRTQLPSTWTSQFSNLITRDDVNDKAYVLSIEVAVASILDRVATPFFEHLNLSVISGEYVTDLIWHKNKLIELENYVKNDVADIDISAYPEMEAVAQEEFKANFLFPVNQTLKKYRSLIEFVDRHLIYQSNTSTLFSVIKNDSEKVKDGNSAARENAKVFQLNVRLSQIDHSLSFQESDFRDLLLIDDHLKNTTSISYVDILQKKCGFLLYKLSFRLQESHQNYLYAINFNYSTVQLSKVADFNEFNDVIEGHYDDGLPPPNYIVKRDAALHKFETAGILTLNDYHILIKYFKDNKRDLGSLENLRTKYEQYYTGRNGFSLFDQKASDVTFCYLDNNILSLELDQGKLELDNWEEKLKKYTDRAEQRKNKNFFPYYKIINKYLKSEIERQFESNESKLTEIHNLIAKFEENLKRLIENLGICEETDYLAFQNNYEGCKVMINNSIACFVASSFVLPLNYKKLSEEIEEYRMDRLKFNSMYEIEKMIDADRKVVKGVKEEIERTDKRNIEILSIFSAIVMFVSNEIQIFSKVANVKDAVAFTLFFAFGLGLFVLMIWFVTRPEGVKLKNFNFIHWFMITLFSLGLSSGIGYLYFSKPVINNANELQKLQFKIDSVKKVKVLDSLLKPRQLETNLRQKKHPH